MNRLYKCAACGYRTAHIAEPDADEPMCLSCHRLDELNTLDVEGVDVSRFADEIAEHCTRIQSRGNVLLDDFRDLWARIQKKPDPASIAAHIREHAEELAALLPSATFALETVAHLQGKERLLLPMTDRLRAILAGTAVKS